MTIGQTLRRLRIENGLTVGVFSRVLGYSPAKVSAIEGDRCILTTEIGIREMARLLSTDPDILFCGFGFVPDDIISKITSSPEVMKEIRSVLGLDLG